MPEIPQCEHKQPRSTIFDLQRGEYICEKCAIFKEEFKNDTLLDRTMVSAMARKVQFQTAKRLSSLKIVQRSHQISHQAFPRILETAIETYTRHINDLYEMQIKALLKEKQEKLQEMRLDMERVIEQCSLMMQHKIGCSYRQLLEKSKEIDRLLEKECKEEIIILNEKILFKEKIGQVEAEIREIISYAEKSLHQLHKVEQNSNTSHSQQEEQPQLDIYEFKDQGCSVTFSQSEIDQENKPNDDFDLSDFQFISQKISLPPPDYRRMMSPSTGPGVSSDDSIPVIKSKFPGKFTLVITKPEEIEEMTNKINLNIKMLVLCGLGLNNQEAMRILRKTAQSYVQTVDLSDNKLTDRFLIDFRREKTKCRYLKRLILRGCKVEDKNNLRLIKKYNEEGLLIDL